MFFSYDRNLIVSKFLSKKTRPLHYINYYYDHCPNGILNVPGYKKIVYENVYPNIDIHFYSNQAGLKAYIVIKPGGDPNNINFKFDGQDSIAVDTSGKMEMYMSGSGFAFPQATAYQFDSDGNTSALFWLPAWNDLGGGYVGLTASTFDPTEALVIRLGIDVATSCNSGTNLLWSTYFGTKGQEEALDVEYEVSSSGAFYTLMRAWHSNFIKVNTGMLPGYQGFHDVHLTRFLSDKSVHWETFYGGYNSEFPQKLEFSSTTNKIYVTGIWEFANSSAPSSGIPFPSTNYGSYTQTVHSPTEWESFITAFTKAGDVYWTTYFGGEGGDNVQSMDIDDIAGILYIAGFTNSTSTVNSCSTPTTIAFPVCNSVSSTFFQSTSSGGINEGFIAAFNISEHSLIYSTFFGGGLDDVIYDIGCSGTSDGLLWTIPEKLKSQLS